MRISALATSTLFGWENSSRPKSQEKLLGGSAEVSCGSWPSSPSTLTAALGSKP